MERLQLEVTLMRSDRVEIPLVCALGAFIGTLIALKLGWLWPLGVIAGGLIGYLTYHPYKVWPAIKRAAAIVFQPFVWVRSALWLFIISLPFTALITAFSSQWLTDLIKKTNTSTSPFVIIQSFMIAIGLVLCLAGLIWMIGILFSKEFFQKDSDYQAWQKGTWFCLIGALLLLYSTFFSYVIIGLAGIVEFVLAFFVAKALFKVLLRIPFGIFTLVRKIARFVALVFNFIHSRGRLLCGVDAAIGAAIGWYFHNPLIGALAGATIGLMNFELISVRFLKLAPSLIRR